MKLIAGAAVAPLAYAANSLGGDERPDREATKYAAADYPGGGPPYWELPKLGSLASTFALRNLNGKLGSPMPVIGMGVYELEVTECSNVVFAGIHQGYKLIDTAAMYENEQGVGVALKLPHGKQREDIFVETKIWGSDHGWNEAQAALASSLQKLQVEYLDMWVIHSPHGGRVLETWDFMLTAHAKGLVKNIGVSNFNIHHFEAIEANGRPLPQLNQIELHPLNYKSRKELLNYCKEKGILVQAYGSLFKGKEHLNHEIVQKIADKYDKTGPQVLLRWAYQLGVQIIPRTSKPERLHKNADIFDFELDQSDLDAIESMEGDFDEYWDPLGVQIDDDWIGDVSRGWPMWEPDEPVQIDADEKKEL